LIGKPEWKRPHGRPRCRWKDIEMNFNELGKGVWSGFIWLRIGIDSNPDQYSGGPDFKPRSRWQAILRDFS
jgi:hypothetical protein